MLVDIKSAYLQAPILYVERNSLLSTEVVLV